MSRACRSLVTQLSAGRRTWGTSGPLVRGWNAPRLRSSRRRPILLSTLTIAGCAASLFGFAPRADAATLTGSTWSTSKTTVGATGTSYTFTFTAATSSSLSAVTMTVPSGTAGTPAVGTVSPGSLAGGSVVLAGTTLTYSFTSAPVGPGTAVSIQINGLTNTATAGAEVNE